VGDGRGMTAIAAGAINGSLLSRSAPDDPAVRQKHEVLGALRPSGNLHHPLTEREDPGMSFPA
jgi:hypothetical protein